MSDTARLSPKELADDLGVHMQTLRAWRKKEKGPPFYRQVGRIWYPRAELDKWREQITSMCELNGP